MFARTGRRKRSRVALEWGWSGHRALIRAFAVSWQASCLGLAFARAGLSLAANQRSECARHGEGHADRRGSAVPMSLQTA
jgi:hypothetical protein